MLLPNTLSISAQKQELGLSLTLPYIAQIFIHRNTDCYFYLTWLLVFHKMSPYKLFIVSQLMIPVSRISEPVPENHFQESKASPVASASALLDAPWTAKLRIFTDFSGSRGFMWTPLAAAHLNVALGSLMYQGRLVGLQQHDCGVLVCFFVWFRCCRDWINTDQSNEASDGFKVRDAVPDTMDTET